VLEEDLQRKINIIGQLHKNKILYQIDKTRNILIDGFSLEKIKENNNKEFFIKYELSEGNMIKWVYVRAKKPDIYYRIKSLYCKTGEAYIKALKKRRLPRDHIKMAETILKENKLKA